MIVQPIVAQEKKEGESGAVGGEEERRCGSFSYVRKKIRELVCNIDLLQKLLSTTIRSVIYHGIGIILFLTTSSKRKEAQHFYFQCFYRFNKNAGWSNQSIN